MVRHRPGEEIGRGREVGRVSNPNVFRGHRSDINNGSLPGVRTKSTV